MPGARVHKLAIVLLLVVAGCRREVRVASAPDVNAPGAATAREALQKFLATAKAQDVQAMSNIWGSAAGPARTTMDQEQLEKRAIYLMRCLRHDSYMVLTETPAAGGERIFGVQLRRGTLTAVSNFTATLGPQGRWYLRDFQAEPLNPICTAK